MNTKEELINFKPDREFFIGVDSDGTVFDSMNIKHLRSFIPAALSVWSSILSSGEKAENLKRIMERINLYSRHRGINRFTGLLLAFQKLEAETGGGEAFVNIAPLRVFVENSNTLSNAALQVWLKENPHPFLDAVYQWSLEADRLFEEHTRNLLPFLNVKPALRFMAQQADVMVVSSASGKSLDKDWSYSGLNRYTALIAGQETGSKKRQLTLASSGKYSPQKVLMIGDAPGDLEAARAAGASFYPVIPGREEESWIRLQEEGLPKFFGGTFRGEYENQLADDFLQILEVPEQEN
jgi:phosphoglycolate phosphatase-like HAD superfamily hydrolase